jgi:hypothetical protein
MAVSPVLLGLLESNRPDLQNVALTAFVVVILVVAAVQAPTPGVGARNHGQDFFQAFLDLGLFAIH